MTLTTLEYKHLEFPSFLSATNSFYKYLFTWFPTNSTKFNKFIMIHINSLTSGAPAAKRPYQDYEARSASPKKTKMTKRSFVGGAKRRSPMRARRYAAGSRFARFIMLSLRSSCFACRFAPSDLRVAFHAPLFFGSAHRASLCYAKWPK